MKNQTLLIIVFGQFIFWGCGQRTVNSESVMTDSVTATNKVTQAPKPARILDNFTDVPEEIEGCSCYYSESEQMYRQSEYLFVAGFDSTAFVSIDNSKLRLKLVSTEREPLSFGDYDHVDVYTTDGYEITLDIKYLEEETDSTTEEDESWSTSGTITIQSEGGLKETIKFFGSCGC
jgi:hypothetical protein